MKKYILSLLLSILILSCSKKEIIISGKIDNIAPLSRVEIINVSSIATLPITNFGFDEKGAFADTINIEKDGIYAIVYNGKANFLYLKKGKNINITGNAISFPEELKITGEGQGNNEFLFESQKFTNEYLSKLDIKVLEKDENSFIKEMEKYAMDINKKIDEIAKSKKADNDVVQWKKNDLLVNLLMISSQYELMHGKLTNKPNFKVSEKFKKEQNKLERNSFIKDFPVYRQYLLAKLESDFRNFATPYLNNNKTTQTEVFLKFLDTKKQLSQETKDYLASFVATQFDFHPQNEKIEQVMKALREKVKDNNIKKDLEKVYNTISGLKIGTIIPDVSLINQAGKSIKVSDYKGKPTLLVFYSSFAPRMVETTAPILKELSDFYKTKMNFIYINMDDNISQFQKTSKSLLKDITGINAHAKGGLKSEMAKQYYIYGFKLPSFVVLDKDSKIISPPFLDIGNHQLIEILNKQTGLSLPIQPQSSENKETELHDGHNH